MFKNIGHKQHYMEILMFLFIAFSSIAGGILFLGVGIDYDIYPSLSNGDALGIGALVKGIQEYGIKGLYFNYRLGAPGIQSIVDFPGADLGMGLLLLIISLFTASPPKIIYIYFLTTFVLNSVSMSLLMRKLQIRRSVTVVFALAFTFAPYHFMRGLGHMELLNNMSVALALYLSICILGYFENEKGWKIVVASLLLGLGYGYYYAFGLIIMALAVIVRLCREGTVGKALKSYIWIPLSTMLSIIIALSPQIIFHYINGKNELAGSRLPTEQELYALKIIQMLFPPEYSRVYALFPKLGDAYGSYTITAPMVNENVTSTLGIVTEAGFIGLCIALIYSFVFKEKCDTKEWLLIDFLSLSVLTLILTGSIGGFGELFSFLVTPQIRCYNRCSIFISGAVVLFMAIMLNRLSNKHGGATLAILMVLLGATFYDTVPSRSAAYQLDIIDEQYCCTSFFNQVESTLSEGAMVYQLPFLEYPESGSEYEGRHFKAYLFTDKLRWSYGGIKGRDNEAAALMTDNGMSDEFINGLRDAGFEAVYIDREMYEDNGEAVLAYYDSLGIEPIISVDGKMRVYDISKVKK